MKLEFCGWTVGLFELHSLFLSLTISKLALRIGKSMLLDLFLHLHCCFEHTHVSSKLNELLAFSILAEDVLPSPRKISADLALLLVCLGDFWSSFKLSVMIIFSTKQLLIIPFSLDHSTTTCRQVTLKWLL